MIGRIPLWGYLLCLLGFVEPLEVLLPPRQVFRFSFSPSMFDWREEPLSLDSKGPLIASERVITYVPSLEGKPDLPDWIHYTFSEAQNLGFIYGVPPEEDGSLFKIEVIATDLSTYSLGIMRLSLNITESHHPFRGPKNAVHLKIDNLNTEDIFASHRLRNLKSIFRSLLWRESTEDLHLIYVSSALRHGYRVPLDPSHKNGILLRLGSNANFSKELLKLDRETGPLRRKFALCPQRDFHRTSVERHFRYEGFSLDWCAFRLMTLELDPKAHYRTVGVMEAMDNYERRKEQSSMNKGPFESERSPPGPLILVPSKSYIADTETPSIYLTLLFGAVLIFVGMVTLIALILCFDVSGNDGPQEFCGEGSEEGFIESFYLVLSDCFKCYKTEDEDPLKPVTQGEDSLGGEVHLRFRRASSIQRQTDSLRRSAIRKASPACTVVDTEFRDEAPPPHHSGEQTELLEQRPYPPPYLYESHPRSESKSYLV